MSLLWLTLISLSHFFAVLHRLLYSTVISMLTALLHLVTACLSPSVGCLRLFFHSHPCYIPCPNTFFHSLYWQTLTLSESVFLPSCVWPCLREEFQGTFKLELVLTLESFSFLFWRVLYVLKKKEKKGENGILYILQGTKWTQIVLWHCHRHMRNMLYNYHSLLLGRGAK